VTQINQWWKERLQREMQLDSCLELQFERHYHRFLMPTLRGTELGSKKRYAGLCRENGEDKLIFKGMETVRSDWTELAKNFQTGLYERIFLEQDPRAFICDTIEKTQRGELDHQLIYRKRLRGLFIFIDMSFSLHPTRQMPANKATARHDLINNFISFPFLIPCKDSIKSKKHKTTE
jgi:hypothetical protein